MGAAMRYQPQGLARIAAGNPLAAGLVGSFIPTSGKAIPVAGASRKLTPAGVGFATNSSADYWLASPTAIASSSPTWTILSVLTGYSSSINAGGATFYSERPNGTQIVKLILWVGSNFASNAAGLVVRDMSGNLVNMQGVADVRTETGKPRVIVGTRRAANDHRLYVDGKLDASSATNVSGSFGATNAIIGNDLQDSGNATLTGASTPLVLVWNRALSDAEIAAISANPWQLFDAGSGSSAYQSAIASLGGVPAGPHSFAYSASGGAVFSGSAARVRSISRVPVGSLTMAGSGQAVRGAARTPQGGLTFSGASSIVRSIARAAAGGLKFAGAAAVSATAQVQARVITPVGGLLLAGAAAVSRATSRAVSGGLSFSGHAVKTAGAAGALLASLLPIVRRRRR